MKIQDKIDITNQRLEQMGDERNSFANTDKDATLMLMKEGNKGVGYNVQIATENQVIVSYEIYKKANDRPLLIPMIEEVERNLGRTPEIVLADKGYCSYNNLEYLERKRINAAVPPQTYDRDRIRLKKGTYRPSENPDYERLKLKMMSLLETEEGKRLLDKRKHDVEPVFGDIKYNMGLRKFLLRTKPKVGVEVALISIAHNIKKIKKWMEPPDRDGKLILNPA